MSSRKIETCPICKIAIVRHNCANVGKSQGSKPKISRFSSRMRAGQTFSPNPSILHMKCLKWSSHGLLTPTHSLALQSWRQKQLVAHSAC